MEDVGTVQCGLRMINAIFIIRKLTKSPDIQLLENIDEMDERVIKRVFEQSMDRLEKLLPLNI
jgi:hypothetical protein